MKLSATTLKYLAIIAMTLDHIAYGFIPSDSIAYNIMRFIGRITAPIMTYFIVEGFRHTQDRKKYLTRMVCFACLAQFPYLLLFPSAANFNILFGFCLVLIVLIAFEFKHFTLIDKILLTTVCFIASLFVEYQCYTLIWGLIFYIFKNKGLTTQIMMFAVWIVSALIGLYLFNNNFNFYQTGILLTIPLLSFYNGKRGGGNSFINKWVFYGFYPLHMLILSLIKNLIN